MSKIIETRDKVLHAINEGDADAIKAHFAPTALRKMPGFPDALGNEEISAVYADFFKTFGKLRAADEYYFRTPTGLVVIWSWQGAHQDTFFEVKATGKTVGATGLTVLDFDSDGLIAREHTYWDPYAILGQLGVVDSGRPVPTLADKAQIVEYGSSPAEAENLKRMRHYSKLLVEKQETEWAACMTDNVAWDDQMVPGLAVGQEAAIEDFRMLGIAFPDARITVTNLWAVGDYVVHQSVFIATHLGPIKGIPPSNKVLHVDNCDVVHFDENGKISAGWTFGNTLDFTAQMGLS